MLHARRFLSSSLSLALVLACNPAGVTPGTDPAAKPGPAFGSEQRTDGSGAPAQPAVTDPVAELTAVHGPAGVRTEDLAEGTFLGAGARLRAGQRLIVPPGTMAELRLNGGTLLRLNEDTRLTVPDGPDGRALELAAGEVVAIVAAGQPPLSVRSGADTLDIASGEARALARGERRSYDVVYGTARLRSGGQEVGMSPGAHVETPLVAPGQPDRPVQPEISLRPLEDTEWSRTFEIAAAMADSVPPGVGSLTARRAGTSAELHKLALTEQKVHVAISGRIARTEVEQTFYNEAGEVLEGTYRFPLPADASISGLSLLVGNTWMDAEMLEKARAREIFRQIVDATIPRDPALLEWEQGNIFKMKIFPIPGRGERKIRLSYTQVLPAVGDNLRYRYPIAGASSGAGGEEIGQFEFTVAVDKGGLPPGGLANVATPMAQLERRELPDRIELSTTKQRFRPVHDLGVDIPLTAGEQRLHSETHLDRDGQAYFMLALKPDLKLPASDRPVHYAFVLDRSHSMTPELWTVARSLLEAMSTSLGADDRMTVLACDAACDVAPGGLAPAAQAMPAVDAFLDPQILAGASDIGGMMRSAAEALGEANTQANADAHAPERVIVYLGDGNASAGELAPDELYRHLQRPLAGTRVQAVALGARSDVLLLDTLTRSTGGDLLRADAKDDLRGLVRQLRLRAEVPVAREVALTLPPGLVYVHPQKLAALRPGETVLLVGKLGGPVHGALEFRATGPSGQVVTDSFQVDLEATPGAAGGLHTHLPRTWARMEIDTLTATQGHSARAEIIDLSRQYTVLSRYTALLVLENDAMFREFNVVRQAGKTTGWNGQLSGNTTTTTPPAAGQVAAPKPTDADEADVWGAPSSSTAPPPAPAPVSRPSPAPVRNERADPTDRPAKENQPAEKAKDENAGPRRSRDVAEEEEATRPRSPAAESAAESTAEPDDDILAPTSKSEAKPGPAPAKKSSPPASKPVQRADSSDGMLGGDEYYGPGGGGGIGSGYGRGRGRPAPRWKINPASGPAYDALTKLEALRQTVLRDPTSRPAHRKLVQNAIRAGAPEAFTYAVAWSQADPDHAPALLAVADLLAARGEAIAMRAYGSAVEVNPFDVKLQTRLAEALASKGDIARSCAHRRAVVSIDPSRPEHHLQLTRCLASLGRTDLVHDAAEDGISRATGDTIGLRAALAGAVRPAPVRPVNGQLKATLTWLGAGDLDIAFIDSRGRRLSALRPENLLVEQLGNGESAAMITLSPQTVAVEVTRFSGQGPISGELKIRTPELSRSYPFTIDQGSLRVANVTYMPMRHGY
ncbi:MAG: FecR domain-containing protein [Nannocystis sp.]|nr:VIT domain-containing protein [Nannocystis sp.]MBA3548031.1 FecR domain-containing protein [Nannocystis sp.]